MKIRQFAEENYKSIFINGKTLRIALDPKKPIKELSWPEFYDVGINTLCYANCPMCYTSATHKGINYKRIVDKIDNFFGKMTENQRAFQVAIGASGEATIHPEFIDVLRRLHELGIVPNYTTNGMHLNDKIMEATLNYCGGVAISLYEHTEKYWRKALKLCDEAGVKTNVHIIISDKESIDKFVKQYDELKDQTEYFVLLAYMNVGRGGGDNKKDIDYDYLHKKLQSIDNISNIAFSSNFYQFLLDHREYKCSLYEPESLSKYLIFDDKRDDLLPSIYNNSFHCKPVEFDLVNGIKVI